MDLDHHSQALQACYELTLRWITQWGPAKRSSLLRRPSSTHKVCDTIVLVISVFPGDAVAGTALPDQVHLATAHIRNENTVGQLRIMEPLSITSEFARL